MISIRTCPESRRFYDRKRAEGKKHTQAVLALARRRVNVIWALLRDDRAYQPKTAPHLPEPLDLTNDTLVRNDLDAADAVENLGTSSCRGL